MCVKQEEVRVFTEADVEKMEAEAEVLMEQTGRARVRSQYLINLSKSKSARS